MIYYNIKKRQISHMARRTDQNALRKQNGHRKSLSDREDSKRIPEKKVR